MKNILNMNIHNFTDNWMPLVRCCSLENQGSNWLLQPQPAAVLKEEIYRKIPPILPAVKWRTYELV